VIKNSLTGNGSDPLQRLTSAGSPPAALGRNDLRDVAQFTKAASGLGLLQENQSKLTGFIGAAAGVGGLSQPPDEEMARACVNAGIKAGLIAPGLSGVVAQAQSLLATGRALGLTPDNYQNNIPGIINKARSTGILPPPGSENLQQGEAGIDPLAPAKGPSVNDLTLRFEPIEGEIQDVTITEEINEHALLKIRGILAPTAQEEDGGTPPDDRLLEKITPGTPAALFSVAATGEVECLFQGILLWAVQTQTTDCKYFEAEVASPSYLLDIEKDSQSFQRMSDTYNDIIQKVAGSAYIYNYLPDVVTDKLIVRYKETVWQFVKRMCSRLNSGLVPDICSDSIRIGFGVPLGGETTEITAHSYTVKKDLKKYQTTKANQLTHSNPAVMDIDFMYYQVKSYDRLKIGNSVTFLGHTLYVRAIKAKLEGSTLVYTYDLVTKQGLVQPDIFNEELAGVSLIAEVKVITKDQVKAHIVEIDDKWDESGDWYFPYSTIFSTPGGSGWYVMPEPGDTIKITMLNNREEDAVAASSVNRTSQAPEKRSNPDHKSLSNVHGKEVLFTPDGIYITNQAGCVFINLTDADGITIISDKNINIEAKENLVIKATKDIIMTADENMKLNCGLAVIKSDKSGLIDIQGQEVRTN
jgi:hypothetical protein